MRDGFDIAHIGPQQFRGVLLTHLDDLSEISLSFIKTSYTRNINDLAPSSIDNVPVRF